MEQLNPEFATKILIPKQGNKVIYRQRLIDHLHEHINLSTQIISAPTGYGKTTLLIDFANDIDIPVCWFSLDTTCQDPKILLDGIMACIKVGFPEFGKLTQESILSNKYADENNARVVCALTGEICIAIPDYFVLVIDDFQSIEDSNQAKMLLNQFIDYIPENCHLIISSRINIELPALISQVMQQRAAKLTESELAFTPLEVQDLLSKHHAIDLSVKEVNQLVSATEGWIIAILLSIRELYEGAAKAGRLTPSRQDIFRFLTSEVFEKQPPEIQDFLLETSILDELEPEICKKFLDITDCRRQLSYVEEHNIFLSCIDDDKGWYRYSKFFREFLQDMLYQKDPKKFVLLHCKLASLYRDGKHWDRAIAHFLIAKEYIEAMKVIKVVGEDYQRSGKWSTIINWIKALPSEMYQKDTSIVLMQAKSLIHLGKVDEAINELTKLISILIDMKEYLNIAQALSWRSAAFRISGYIAEAKVDIEDAIELIEKHDGKVDELGEANRRLGDIYKEMGQFEQALYYMKRALECYSIHFDVACISETHNSIGTIYKRLGDYRKAEIHFEHARQGWQKVNNLSALAGTLNNIGNVYQHWGQHELALETFRLGLEKAREANYQRTEANLLINMAEAYRDLEQYNEALKTYKEGLDLARLVMETYYVMWAKAGIGETYQYIKEYEKAVIFLNEAITLAEENGQIYETTIFAMKLGMVEYNVGNYDKAITVLNNACKQLVRLGDKDTLARAYLHLAQASFLARRFDEALSYLRKSSELADELNYDDFFISDGRKAILLFQYGITNGVSADRFIRVIEKIRQRYERRTGYKASKASVYYYPEAEPQIRAYAFGETRVSLDNHLINDSDWRSNRAKEMFFYLLCCSNGQSKEHIVTTFWPDLSPAKSTSNFHINLYRARRAVFPGIFTLEQGYYKLNPLVNVWFDTTEFRRLLDQVERTPRGSKIWSDSLAQAIELYKGPFMPEFYSEWVEIERRELENKYLNMLSKLANLKGERKEYNKAISLLENFITVDPYHEEVYCKLIEWYLAMGDKIYALRTYKRYLDIVTSELDVKPSTRLDDLYKDILAYKSD